MIEFDLTMRLCYGQEPIGGLVPIKNGVRVVDFSPLSIFLVID